MKLHWVILSGRLTFEGEKIDFSEFDFGRNQWQIHNIVEQGDAKQVLLKLNGAPRAPEGPLEVRGHG